MSFVIKAKSNLKNFEIPVTNIDTFKLSKPFKETESLSFYSID